MKKPCTFPLVQRDQKSNVVSKVSVSSSRPYRFSDEHRAASGGISSTFCRSGPCLRYSDPECRLPSKCSESIFVEVAQRCKAQVVSSGPSYPLYVLQSDVVRSIAYPRRRARNAPMIGLCRVLRIVSGWSSSSDNFQTINTHYAEGVHRLGLSAQIWVGLIRLERKEAFFLKADPRTVRVTFAPTPNPKLPNRQEARAAEISLRGKRAWHQ